MTADGELAFHILRYGAQKLSEDDLSTLLDLGFSMEDIQAIETLTLKELNHLSCLSAHFLDVRINPQRFARVLAHIRQETAGEVLQNELLRRRAPAGMMRALFGMTPLQYANRRKRLGLSGVGVGRPAFPGEETERLIWQVWHEQAELSDAERYLATAEATQLPLSVIWSVRQAWQGATRSHDNDDGGSTHEEAAVKASMVSGDQTEDKQPW
jgi:hypothetical protein